MFIRQFRVRIVDNRDWQNDSALRPSLDVCLIISDFQSNRLWILDLGSATCVFTGSKKLTETSKRDFLLQFQDTSLVSFYMPSALHGCQYQLCRNFLPLLYAELKKFFFDWISANVDVNIFVFSMLPNSKTNVLNINTKMCHGLMNTYTNSLDSTILDAKCAQLWSSDC